MSLDIYLTEHRPVEVHEQNITHNLGNMAKALGIYEYLWHPNRAGVESARDLIGPLDIAIQAMKAEPDPFKMFDAPNGWGTYDQFLPWLEELLQECTNHPNARIEVSI